MSEVESYFSYFKDFCIRRLVCIAVYFGTFGSFDNRSLQESACRLPETQLLSTRQCAYSFLL